MKFTKPPRYQSIPTINAGNNSYQSVSPTEQAKIDAEKSISYLNSSNCSDQKNNRIVRLNINNKSTGLCENPVRYESFNQSTSLNNEYLHIALCSSSLGKLKVNRYTDISSSSNPTPSNQCSGQKAIEAYTLNIKKQ